MNRSSAMASCGRRRAACTAAAGLLVALAAAPVADATTLTSGVLTDKNGHPSAGTVAVYPSPAKTGKWPMLGSATAGADGRFSIEVADPSALGKYTRGSGRQRVGDYTAWVTLTDGSTGTWTFSGIVDGRGPATKVIDPDALSTAGAASAAGGISAPFIRVPARDKPLARGRASASAWPAPKDCPLVSTEVVGDDDAWTVIGELNNAYNDGTQATFTYGTAQETSSYIGVATKLAGGEFSIDGETYIRDRGSVADSQARRYARKILSGFHYKRLKQVGYGFCTGRTYYTVIATRFLGGKTTHRQRGTLDKCARNVVGSRYDSGGQFHREVNTAVRWSAGVNVFGVGLTTRSGFDRDVQLDYAFKGPPDKAHYLCGPDGRQSPMIAGRVFSGGR
jgi:hypothetical protein